MALAGQQDHVAGLGQADGVANCRRTVVDHEERLAVPRAGPAGALGDGLVDEPRILETGILVGDDGDVRQLGAGPRLAGRLVGSRSPAEPNTAITRPLASGRRMRSTLLSESAVCA